METWEWDSSERARVAGEWAVRAALAGAAARSMCAPRQANPFSHTHRAQEGGADWSTLLLLLVTSAAALGAAVDCAR